MTIVLVYAFVRSQVLAIGRVLLAVKADRLAGSAGSGPNPSMAAGEIIRASFGEDDGFAGQRRPRSLRAAPLLAYFSRPTGM